MVYSPSSSAGSLPVQDVPASPPPKDSSSARPTAGAAVGVAAAVGGAGAAALVDSICHGVDLGGGGAVGRRHCLMETSSVVAPAKSPGAETDLTMPTFSANQVVLRTLVFDGTVIWPTRTVSFIAISDSTLSAS